MISAIEAAKHLCRLSDWTLTNLKLQKILYISHMAHMGEHGGAPLIDGNTPPFEAWEFGPVSPNAYRYVRDFGSEKIPNIFRSVSDVSGNTEAAVMKNIYGQLKGWTPGQLVAFTHRNDGAWAQYYRSGQRGIVIPNEAILDEYRRLEQNQ